jgi:AcrR family transcriptional regulator
MVSAQATIDDAIPRKRAASLPADERRSMIVDATLPLVLEHGDKVTTHDIAAAAGIAEGTIFRVFESKDALMEAVMDQALDPGPVERAIEAIDPDLGLEESVTQVVALVQRRVLDIWRLLSGLEAGRHRHGRRPPPEMEALRRLFEAYRDELQMEPAQAARLLRSVILAMTHPMMAVEAAPPDEVARRFLYGAVGRRC